MGGTNELCILGYRAHVSEGKVHLHSDNIKFTKALHAFKNDLREAAEALKSEDGAFTIEGDTDVSLIVGRHNRMTFTTLTVTADATIDLLRWVEGC